MILDNGNKVIDAIWFSNLSSHTITDVSDNTIGIVVVKIKQGGIKAYIGTGNGEDEELDIKKIARLGSRFDIGALSKLNNHFIKHGDYDSK